MVIEFIPIDNGVRFGVKAVPGASRDGIAGELGGALKVRVSRPAERGKANAAIVKLLAKALGVKRHAVRIVSGKTSPSKTVEVAGITAAEAASHLAERRTHRKAR